MTVLLLLAVVVLVLLNGFFVAAEFALVRVRRARVEEDAVEGKRGAQLVLRQLDELSRYLAACQLGITFTSLGIGFLGEPAVADIIENLLGEELPHGVALAISFGARVPDHHLAAHHDRRAGPEDLRDQPGRADGALDRPPAASVHPDLQPVHPPAQRGLELDAAAGRDPRHERVRGGRLPEELKVLIAQSLTGGQLDPGEARC